MPNLLSSRFAGARIKGNNDGLRRPTQAEYTGEAAKESLKVIEAIAQEIPIPGVASVVKIAAKLVTTCEESHATLEKAEVLKWHINLLVAGVVNDLKGKGLEDISEKLIEDIEALQSDFRYIGERLDEITSQSTWRLVFFRTLNEDRVQKCIDRLDNLLKRFNISRHMDLAVLVQRLEKGISDLKVAKENHSSSPIVGPRSRVPSPKGLFYGRDSLVSDLVIQLASTLDGREKRHTCILAPGGMGKTSTALAVVGHSDVKARYPDNCCVWVPCVKATSVQALFDTLASSLGIIQSTGNMNENILSALKTSDPLLLLLDNFETPWNVDGGRSEAERMLRDINQIPHITLFVTMRSSAPPCTEISWYSINLKAVDAAPARQIYASICQASNVDPHVPELLDLVGHMPLAITLMATSASFGGLSASDLIDQYKKHGITMLSQGSDAEHSMDICIACSVNSPPMKRNSEAQWLLSALAMLPLGTTYNMLRTWWAPHLVNLPGALQVLGETSLVERQGSTFSTLPVIQRYILDPSRFDESVRRTLVASACRFLRLRSSFARDDGLRKDHTAALAAEEGNLEAVLLQVVSPSKDILDALLQLAWYQRLARPRTNAIDHALTLVQKMEDKHTHGAVLSCYGSICFALDRYEDCQKHLMDARELFLSIPDIRQAASCLLEYVSYDIDPSATPQSRNVLIAQAEFELESVGDTYRVAQAWLARGTIACDTGDYDVALSLLRRAQDKFTELKQSWASAECSLKISACYFRKEEFEEAKTWVESALQEFDRMGASDRKLVMVLHLALMDNALGNHDVALETVVQSLDKLKVRGAPVDMGLALEQMGIAQMQMGQLGDARAAFQEALDVYLHTSGMVERDRCRYWVRKAKDSNTVPTLRQWSALKNEYPRKMLKMLGVTEPTY